MAFDGLTIRCLIKELNEQLANQRVEKIYQPEMDEIVLVVRQRKGSLRLVISCNSRWYRMHITKEKKENPARPSSFCMLLRKHLEGARILEFSQPGLERIVNIVFDVPHELLAWQRKVLVAEFTGKHSNLLLVDPETETIIDAVKRSGFKTGGAREVQPGSVYTPPPSQGKLNPLITDYPTFYRVFWIEKSELTASNALFQTFEGFSPSTCLQILLKAGVDPHMPVEECGEHELVSIYEAVTRPDKWKPQTNSVTCSGQVVVDFFPFLPVVPEGVEIESFATLNEALDFFYTQKLRQTRFESLRSNLCRNVKSHLEKLRRKLALQEGDLLEAKKGEVYRIWGELLLAYPHEVKKGQKEVLLPDFDGSGTVKVELAPHLGPIENAKILFKQYNKARKAEVHLQNLMADTRKEIEYLETVKLALERAETLEDLEEIVEELEQEGYMRSQAERKKREARKMRPRSFCSVDGFKIYVGRNNKQNEYLTLRLADNQDLWFHAQGFPGTHVLLKVPPHIKDINQIPDQAILDAALLAAHFSRGHEAEKLGVDYTYRSQVKKPRGSRPGMVIYENYWTVYVNPQDERLAEILATEGVK